MSSDTGTHRLADDMPGYRLVRREENKVIAGVCAADNVTRTSVNSS